MNLQVAITQQTLIDVQSDPNLFLLIHDGNKIQIGSVIELVLMEDNTAKPLDPPFIVEITRLNKYGLKPEQVQIFFDRYIEKKKEKSFSKKEVLFLWTLGIIVGAIFTAVFVLLFG